MDVIDIQLEPVRALLAEIGHFMPRLALAVVVLIAGWLLGKLARVAVVKGLRAINFNILTERAGMDGFLRQGGIERDTTDLVGGLAFWVVMLLALIVASSTLGLGYVTELLRELLLFAPRLVVALLILILGAYFARFLGQAVIAYLRNVRIPDAEVLGRLVRYGVLTFVVIVVLDQLAIGGDLIRQSFLLILAGVVLALALAFGIGGRKWAEALLERWFPVRREEDKR